MAIAGEYLDALAIAAERFPGPRVIPWPSPGMPGGFVSFGDFAEWQQAILGFRLPAGVPCYMADLFDRALKLYLAAWLDFDLTTAGDLAAFGALEHSLRDCYLGYFRKQHTKKIVARAKNENRSPRVDENFRPEKVPLAALLQHMYKCDGLTEEQLSCVQRYGGSILGLLNGEANPSLTEVRNVMAHGNPFGSGYRSGLLELVRDLIEYAYRENIRDARSTSHEGILPEFLYESDDPESAQIC